MSEGTVTVSKMSFDEMSVIEMSLDELNYSIQNDCRPLYLDKMSVDHYI
jgi:hypothetical protein